MCHKRYNVATLFFCYEKLACSAPCWGLVKKWLLQPKCKYKSNFRTFVKPNNHSFWVAKGNTVPNLATLRKLHAASSYRKNFHLVYNTLKMIIQYNLRMVFLENVEVASAIWGGHGSFVSVGSGVGDGVVCRAWVIPFPKLQLHVSWS